MAITSEHVLHTASLARLRLHADEVARLTAELSRILNYFDQLEMVDTEGVSPTEHLEQAAAPLREDEPRPGLSHEAALAPAPRVLEDGFAVPGFMD